MTAVIELLNQSPESATEVFFEAEETSRQKSWGNSFLDPFRSVRPLVGRAVFQATSIMGFRQDAAYTSFKVGDVAVVRYLVSTAEMERSVQDTNARLDELLQLPQDWYAHGANRITDTAVGQAKLLVSSLSEWHHGILGVRIRPQGVIPLPDGGVELIWRGSRGKLEVLISPNNELDYVVEVGQGPHPPYEDGVTSIDRVPVLLNRIL